MIKNILDNYISNNLIRCMKSWAVPYGINVMSIEKNKTKTIYIKDSKVENKHYKEVLKIRNEDAILYLSNLVEMKKEFTNVIKNYQRLVK